MIGNQWIPTTSREGDVGIIYALVENGVKGKELTHLNRCRIYSRVMTVADLISIDGQHIDMEVVRGRK